MWKYGCHEHTMLSMAMLVTTVMLLGSTSRAQIDWAEDDDDPVSTTTVEAVLGRTATLPCDITPDEVNDRVYMVLWFRESAGKPLYSYDVRGRQYSKALYWSETAAFGPRAYFVTVSKPAALTVDNIQLDDEGVYRCRVDFQNSPTRNHRINLTVTVPPHQILVYDASGRDVAGAIGPLQEDDNLVLTCEVRGGRPEPTVSWLNGDEVMQTGGGVSMGRHVTVNRLEIQKISRAALNNTYKCQASNTIMVPPAERSVRVEMLLKPISTSLSSKPKQLISDQEYSLSCDVEGSVPDTEIRWMQNNRPFTKGKIRTVTNSSTTTSVLIFQPHPEDDGTILKCEGSNPRLQNSVLEDSIIMNVMYPPQVTLSLGSTLNPDDIKEGDDVYFECHIKANPREHRITWSHDGSPVTQNVTSGVIISTRSLVLQKVGRYHSGMYACTAANDRGETQSEPVTLRIHFAPVCASSSIMIVGASLDETVAVPCHVVADPLDVSFDWNFSNSGERFEVTSGQFNLLQDFHSSDGNLVGMSQLYDGAEESSETIYELPYTPKSERDYGTLACWGKNSIGKQLEPCLFQVVPAAKPAPLRNCTLRPYSTLLASQSSSSNSSAASASSSSTSSSSSFYYGSAVGGVPETVRASGFSSSSSASNGATIGQHYRESNYISTQFVKDRNVSNERTNITKFNQKSTSHAGISRSVSKRREQIKQKNATHSYGGSSRPEAWLGSSNGRISIASHNVGLTSIETVDEADKVTGRGELRVATQISSSFVTSASKTAAAKLGVSGSTSFSSSSPASNTGEQKKKNTISNDERNSGANLFNTITLEGESIQSSSYSADDSSTGPAAGLSTASNHRLAKREKHFNENLESEINKTHYDDDGDEIFNSTDTSNQDVDGDRTIESGISGSVSSSNTIGSGSSISGSTITSQRAGTNSRKNNYHTTEWHAPTAAKLTSNNIRYNRYHSMESGGNGGGSVKNADTSTSKHNPGTTIHSFSHYMESVEVPTTMELECVAGYDGGLPQHFFLEAYDSRTRKLRLNITSALNDVPLFRIDLSDLIPSDSFTPTLHLIAYSVNQKGRSEPTVLEDIAINEAEKRTDGTDGFSILPLAALLTGALFTIGIAVLLVVVLAIRRKRDGHGTGLCDGKEKHIGMDITVTTPLEMGMGQQKYVVAYTLKQGVEKQPDILSAQKTQGSTSMQSIKDIQKMGSPVGIRPDALCSTGMGGGGGIVGAKQSTIYATQCYDQKSTPSSRQSTLKRNDTSNTYSLLQQQQQPHHLQSKPPPSTTTGLPQYSTSYTSGGDLLDYEEPYGYSTLSYNHASPPLADPYSYKSSPTDPADRSDYEKNLDYRLLNISNEIKNNSAANHIEYRNNLSHTSSNNQQSGISSNSVSCSRPQANGSGNPEYRYSGSEFATDLMDFNNVPSPSSSTNAGTTLSKPRNRQHIITDTLPGPESCV
ncbi:serine-rich adhesin for platelets isoform X2 [Topomyia yanbarensis]|uniref:serine-rich adhesin for platelets isoform X2 n=1 Tax=Topomyia yanbarensis TaxID=2498891 RepID=UPI00273C19F3|nr:serine-rich adhesin for platelets isoform X2 [Topomyia yanbarensis]